MTADDTAAEATAAQTIATLQQNWILGWNKPRGESVPSFDKVFAEFYDFDAPVILFDDFDPDRRVFRTVQAYADAFWPTFQQFASAEHAIEEAPEVIVSGDLAVTRMVFIAILEHADGAVVATRATNSQVWRHTQELGWRILRDHTGVEQIPVEEAQRAFS